MRVQSATAGSSAVVLVNSATPAARQFNRAANGAKHGCGGGDFGQRGFVHGNCPRPFSGMPVRSARLQATRPQAEEAALEEQSAVERSRGGAGKHFGSAAGALRGVGAGERTAGRRAAALGGGARDMRWRSRAFAAGAGRCT